MHTNILLAEPQVDTPPRIARMRRGGRSTLVALVQALMVGCSFGFYLYLSGVAAAPPSKLDPSDVAMLAGLLFFVCKWLALGRSFKPMKVFRVGARASLLALSALGAVIAVLPHPLATLPIGLEYFGVLGLVLLVTTTLLFDELAAWSAQQTSARPVVPRARRIALLGQAANCRALAEHVTTVSAPLHIVGIFDPADPARTQSDAVLEVLLSLLRRRLVDEVVVALSGADDRELAPALQRIAAYPVDISVSPGQLGWSIAGVACHGGTLFLPLVRQPARGWKTLGKRFIDLSLAVSGLVCLSPLLLVTAIAIKLDSPGPVFFRQWRTGFNQVPFLVWKFRTMHGDAEPTGGPFRQARLADDRVTRIGRTLRRLSIDELPQLLNVLMGEMSLVGPRPHPLPLNEQFADRLSLYDARHRVLPGITGLAQVNGCRGETDTLEKMAKRLDYDLLYIRSWSVWLDVKIIFMTLTGRFTHRNAY